MRCPGLTSRCQLADRIQLGDTAEMLGVDSDYELLTRSSTAVAVAASGEIAKTPDFIGEFCMAIALRWRPA
jgi:hypothetical protein